MLRIMIKHKGVGLKHYNDSKTYIECSNDMDDIYENIEEQHLNKGCKILIYEILIKSFVSIDCCNQFSSDNLYITILTHKT